MLALGARGREFDSPKSPPNYIYSCYVIKLNQNVDRTRVSIKNSPQNKFNVKPYKLILDISVSNQSHDKTYNQP